MVDFKRSGCVTCFQSCVRT